jgi:2-succinyl-6-hydroxy-2,4-cyclohexadiene-1-carboxylate synthase
MKVVLALHGFLGLPSDWSEVQKEFHTLQRDYELIPVDYMNLRGLTPDVSLERWGENFCLWAEKNFPRKEKVIAGYSLGGRLALHALQSKISTWSKAIFLSTNPGLATDFERSLRKDMDLKWAQRFQTADFETVVREWNQQPVFLKSNSEPVRRAENYNSEILAKALVQWSLGKQRDFSSEAAAFQIQNLWLAGREDQKFVKIIEQLAEKEKPHQSSIVDQASHRILFDQPSEVAKIFTRFLQPR